MNLTCNKPGCTLAETGSCILENNPETCPDRLQLAGEGESAQASSLVEAVIPPPPSLGRLSSSFTMNIDQVNNLMQRCNCKLVGILGAQDAGKTACLVSSYLLLAHDKLAGFKFRNSKTIRAFEEISRGARWASNEDVQQFTVRTKIADERTPGFLHLRIQRYFDGNTFDFVFPDLPGEWTNSLIETNRIDRLSFLKSVEQIWIVINGGEVNEKSTRKLAIHRIELILQRLETFLDTRKPPISIVVTHKDRYPTIESHFANIIEQGLKMGFDLKVLSVASFTESEDSEVEAGNGIAELIDDLVTIRKGVSRSMTLDYNTDTATRNMLHYGKNRASHE